MCFSASASFSAAALLSVIGIAAIRHASYAKRAIAVIPLLFAFQQASEGFVWLYSNTNAARAAGTLFLFFAYIWWPIWLPYAFLRYAKATENQTHTRICQLSLVAGISASFGLIFYWAQYGIFVGLGNCHILYQSIRPAPYFLTTAIALLYFIATLVPQITARPIVAQITGWLTACACAFSLWAYYNAFTSVWCFFAAIISAGVLWFVYEPKTVQ